MGSHTVNKLLVLFIKKAASPGKYGDGNGLYLVVEPSGAKRWEQRLTIQGRRRDIGLGSVSIVSLEDARTAARDNKRIARLGGDPLAEKYKRQGEMILFKDVALSVHALHAPALKNKKYAEQWLASLENHVFPLLGDRAISSVTSADILTVLTPIWSAKHDTAKKIRQRLSIIMKWAKAQGYVSGDNPVELANPVLPKQQKTDNHFTALPYYNLPNLITLLQSSKVLPSTKLALEFLLLTACRQSEVLAAEWCEIDFENKRWIIPATRMKAGRTHEIPLSSHALRILSSAKEQELESHLLFPNPDTGRPLSDNTLRHALQKRLKLNTTVHGLRSSFKDWASETTNHSNEVTEMALAHSISNAAEAAYRRGTLFEKRRHLMNDWADFLYSSQTKVLKLVQGDNS